MSAPVVICDPKDAEPSSFAFGPPFVLLPASTTSPAPDANIVEDESSTSSSSPIAITHQRTKAKLPPRKKRSSKQKESKRNAGVSFEEMQRLMRVYGPTKCLRNRSQKDAGKPAKMLSIKRKFFRWFPNFHERFALQDGGWYKPLIGHEAEISYREELRKKDQAVLAAKRLAGKSRDSNKTTA
ncbi:hypothetical protein ACHAXT_004705 [Thalassiosira profunda]